MKFHLTSGKCDRFLIQICSALLSEIGIPPCMENFYNMGGTVLAYTDSEKDLDTFMNTSINFTEQANFLYDKVNQKFGMLKRNCHFVSDIHRRKVLYLTLVRSIFGHCPVACVLGQEQLLISSRVFRKGNQMD